MTSAVAERNVNIQPNSELRAPTSFVLAGGGTGGHVIPLIAVAEELRRRGHEVVFFGTERGIEARLVPAKGFRLEFIEIGGLKGVGVGRVLHTLWQLPASTWQVRRYMRSLKPGAVFSMGGYVAGPTVLAALLAGVPVVAMEPNAAPGITNRRLGRYVAQTLIAFPETANYFPAGKTELTGLPVREDFFAAPARRRGERLNLLITGGSRGSRTLNAASRASWPLFRAAGYPIRILHQSGREEYEALRGAFAGAGLDGEVVAFIEDMASAFAEADLVVCRAGAGAVSELAAAGKPSVLVPFPFAADQHQLRNARAFERAAAAQVLLDAEMTGEKLFRTVTEIGSDAGRLERMGVAARNLARPGAARRAADLLEKIAAKRPSG